MIMTQRCAHYQGGRLKRANQRGFTLIELTLAISVLAVMVMLNYKTLRGLIEAKLALDDKRDGMYIANSLLTRMARELQLIVPTTTAPGPIIPNCDSLGPAPMGAAAASPAPPTSARLSRAHPRWTRASCAPRSFTWRSSCTPTRISLRCM